MRNMRQTMRMHGINTMLMIFAILCTCNGPVWAGEPASPQPFTLTERFGVAYPEQVIDFDLAQPVDATACRLQDAGGQEVAYQLLDGGKKLAFSTDLPAHASKTWQLVPGKPTATALEAVNAAEVNGCYEITNGLTGIRVPMTVPVSDVNKILAPLQGVRYHDGTWTATGPNYLSVKADAVHEMTVRFLERGPLVTTVEVAYRFDRPASWHPSIKELGREAGPGYYRSTITLQAGQPSIIFEEDTDMDLSYSLNCYAGLRPTNARYRGHHASAKEFGYEADGRVYRMAHERPAMDAFVDLQYQQPQLSAFSSSPKSWARMTVWNPWGIGTGQYWMLYNKDATDTANMLGIFAGSASRALGATNCGTGIYTTPAVGGVEPAAGLTVTCDRWSPFNTFYPHVRYQWGMYLATKHELTSPYDVQPIARQMNSNAGINLNKVHRWTADFPDPAEGHGAMYVKPEVIQRLRMRMRDDDAFYQFMASEFSLGKDLDDLWHDKTGDEMRKAVVAINKLGQTMLNAYVNGDGIYDSSYSYWMGGLEMQRNGEIMAQLLDDPRLSAEERAQLKAIAALFANILWDDDFVPLFAGSGVPLGTENMPMQQTGSREYYAMLLAGNPTMKAHVEAMRTGMIDKVHHLLNAYGAQFSSSGYQHASMMSTLGTLQRMQRLGTLDAFRDEPRLAKYGEFYMGMLTPPDPRFGKGWRQLIKVGDDSLGRGSHLPALLATGFAEAKPELSARLMGAWKEMGSPYDDFFNRAILHVDDALPTTAMKPRSGDFPGYYSVLRSAGNTPNETAVWFINGDFLRDHRHADMGEVVIWALGAPLSVDMGTNYDPLLEGTFFHSVAIPEAAMKQHWDEEVKGLNDFQWAATQPDKTDFAAFQMSGSAAATFRNPGWRRAVRLISGDPALPVIVVQDRFTAKQTEPWVLNFNLMAEGDVATPAGKYTPIKHTYTGNNQPNGEKQMPSVGPIFPLAAGVNTMRFTGPQWGTADKLQSSIDFDLCSISPEQQQAYIGNWAHQGATVWAYNAFQQANGRPFEERQDNLRVRGSNGFTTLILPYRKGQQPVGRTVTQDSAGVIRIAWRDEETRIGANWQSFSRGKEVTMLALLDGDKAYFQDITISGGPTEVIVDKQTGTVAITVNGTAGVRTLKIPGRWQESTGITRTGGVWTLNYTGGEPLTITLKK